MYMKKAFEYVQMEVELSILDNTFSPQEKIPTVKEMEVMYNVGSTAIKDALGIMQGEGTIMFRKGVGYFVMPFSKNKLFIKHKEILKESIKDGVKHARRVGMDKDDLKQVFNEIVEHL